MTAGFGGTYVDGSVIGGPGAPRLYLAGEGGAGEDGAGEDGAGEDGAGDGAADVYDRLAVLENATEVSLDDILRLLLDRHPSP